MFFRKEKQQLPTMVLEGELPVGTQFEKWADMYCCAVTSYSILFPTQYQATLTLNGELVDIKTTDKNFPKHELSPDGRRFLTQVIHDTGVRIA